MKTNHLPLIIGIALPIIFIAIVAIAIFTPSMFVKPMYNFVYTTENKDYYSYYHTYKNTYKVENNHIQTEANPVPPKGYDNYSYKGDFPTLYIYDVKTMTSHETSLADVQNLNIDPGPSSPDGYTVGYEYSNDGIFELFGSNSTDRGYFISKDNGHKRLTGLINGDSYGSGSFRLIGWIK